MGLKSWFQSVLGTTYQLNADDIVVFMVGPSGGGKSWFIEEVTNSPGLIQVGEKLQPHTKKMKAVRCSLTGDARIALQASAEQRNIVFVDTPSFHTGTGNQGTEKKMSQWLSNSKSKSTLVGTIYVDRVENDPSYESTTIQDYLNGFAYTFPQDFFSLPYRLHGLLSYEGMLREEKVRSRLGALQVQLDALGPSLLQGGRMLSWRTSSYPSRFQQGDHEKAWQAVVALFSSRA